MKLARDQSTQKALAARIGQLYLSTTAPFQLPEKILKDILCGKNSCPSHSEEIAILTQAQRQVMCTLKAYWCKQFMTVAHHKTSMCDQDEATVDQDKEEVESTDSLPQVIVDRGKEGFQMRATKLLPLLNTTPCTGACDQHNTATCQLPQLLITPSTQMLFQVSNISPRPHLLSRSGSSSCLQKRVHQQQQLSFLQASLRCNLSAGAPLNHFFNSSHCHMNGKAATNLLLFWSSVENLLTKDELRKWHNRRCAAAGSKSAYHFLFDNHPLANDLESLLELHFYQTSPFPIQLPALMKEQLQTLLPKGLGHSTLLSAQDYVSQVYCHL